MFTSHERVVRNGYLIAFAGEVMSDEEAARRGLLDHPDEKREQPKAAAPEAPTVKQIKATLDDLGVDYPKNANKATLLDILADVTADDDSDDDVDDDDDLYVDDDDDEETE